MAIEMAKQINGFGAPENDVKRVGKVLLMLIQATDVLT